MSHPIFDLLHPGIQRAIWKMRWPEFKPIQVQAIRAISETEKHLVICAPTAGGKTEAAFLPIISRLAFKPLPSVQAIYVGPLKALINDQFRRLEDLCQALEMPVHRWHGDIPANQKKALRDSPSGILLITPESLESNFINFGSQVPRVYRHLSFVVIDELHSFFGNERGVHLQSLLSRLRNTASCSPRMVGLSATLADPQAARAFLAPDAVDSVHVIDDSSGKREIKFGIKSFLQRPSDRKVPTPRLTADQCLALASHLSPEAVRSEKQLSALIQASKSAAPPAPAAGDDALGEIADHILHSFAESTNLIFGNAKSAIEELADKLHQRVTEQKLPVDPFFVHHGSLSKDLRLDAEAALKSGLPTTALCSSTLEMGIDIGNVRAIGQLDPPWTVSSMIQRLGRSGRPADEPQIMRLYVRADSPHSGSSLTDLLFPDLLRSIAMTRLMLANWLEPFEQNGMHLSTLIHQTLSFVKQTGGMSAADLFRALCQLGPFRSVTQAHFVALLRGLAQHDILEQVPQGELILGLLGERITSNFDFYSAFQTPVEFVVRAGHEELGKLPESVIPPVGEHILLAGKRWRILELILEKRLVLVVLAPGKKPTRFLGSRGEIHTRVIREIKSVLLADDEPPYLDATSKTLLRASRRTARMLGLDNTDLILGHQFVQWFPWVGTRALLTLSLLAEFAKISHETDQLSITYYLPSPDDLCAHLLQFATSPPDPTALSRLLPMGLRFVDKFDEFVPPPLLDEANSKSRLDISGAIVAAKSFVERFRNHL
jgi:ATP-dependent Lhr-like helicase